MESQQELIMKIRRCYSSLLSLKKDRRDHHRLHRRRRCLLSFSLSIICCLPNHPSHYATSFKAPISYHYYSSSFSNNRIPRGGSSSNSTSNNNNNNNNMADGIMNDDYDDTMINPSEEVEDDEEVVIGGGAINEKKRTYSSYGGSNKYLDDDNNKSSSSKIKNSTSTFRGTTNRAHLMHAIEGLHRYPNYLSRWQLDDIEELETALQKTLDKVRDQKSHVIKHRNDMEKFLQEQILSSKEESAEEDEEVEEDDNEWIKEFIKIPETWNDIQEKILDPKASKAIFRSQMFRVQPPPFTVLEVLNGQIQIELDVGYLQQLMDEECYDCYSFPIFSKQFCLQLRRFIKYVIAKQKQQQIQIMQGNNNDNETRRMLMMTKDLDNIGLRWLNDLLLHLFVRPISKHLYKETELDGDGDGDLDWRQGFIAAYSYNPTSTKPRQRLVPHTDDSEVTLNICLGDDNFEGGNLNLWGLRGSTDGNLKGEVYEPEIGRALIHSGRQLHEVTDITFGDRYAYILWTRSWNGIRSTTCPCCWLNNRGGQRRLQQTNNNNNNNIDCCICGRRWN